jgi:hypothetical protein
MAMDPAGKGVLRFSKARIVADEAATRLDELPDRAKHRSQRLIIQVMKDPHCHYYVKVGEPLAIYVFEVTTQERCTTSKPVSRERYVLLGNVNANVFDARHQFHYVARAATHIKDRLAVTRTDITLHKLAIHVL